MIDGAQFLQQFLYGQQCELWDIESLQPTTFVQRLLSFPFTGFEQRLMGFLQQAMFEYKGERAIMKYIYIIDKLIKVPTFAPAIHNSIVDIYTDLFMFLLAQKCQNQIDELKILRKYWVGKLHPFLLSQIKERIVASANMDVDGGFKQETINRIRDYYSNKLQLSPEEIAFHLPYSQKYANESRTNNQRYMVENKPVYPMPNQNYNLNNLNYHSNNIVRYPLTPQPPLYNSYIPPSQPLQMPAQPIQIPHIINPDMNQREELKRKRLASEQTRVALNIGAVAYDQPKPRKIQHKNQLIIDYKFMLSKLKQMNPYACRECGLKFCCNDSHQTHKNQHFKEKLNKIQKNNRPTKKYTLSNTETWTNEQDDLNLTTDKFCIPVPPTAFSSKRCDFCCAEMNIQFRADRWVYINATTVKIAGGESILHKSCQLALDVSSESEEEMV